MKKKILIFHPYLAPYRIGVYNKLAEDFEIKVLLTGSLAEIATLGFDLENINKQAGFDFMYYHKGKYLGRHLFSSIYFKIIEEFQPDVVIAHEYGINTLAAIVKQKRMGFKLFITCDDSPAMAQEYSLKRECLRRFIMSHIDGMIVVSPLTKQYLEEKYPKTKCECVYFPIIQDDKALLHNILNTAPQAEKWRKEYCLTAKSIVLFVGRLEGMKRIDLLIKSYQRVRNDQSMLVIVGGGSLEQSLKDLVKRLELEKQVVFTGPLSGADLYAWYYLADIFVLPSNREAFGAVVNEALVGGCNSIVSDHAGAHTLIDEHNGYVFESENQHDLERKLKDALGNINSPKKHDSLMPHTFIEYYRNLVKSF